jgi:hypothetical protein
MSGARRLAIAYVLGLVPDEARRSIGLRRRSDVALDGAIVDIEALIANGPISAGPGTGGPDALFARIMTEIAGRSADQGWREARPGASILPLWDESSFLVRCAGGTPFPGHLHEREERTVMLDGALLFGARPLSSGMCEVAPKGSLHEAGEAREDCLFLLQYGD